jgi:hypothetical protein
LGTVILVWGEVLKETFSMAHKQDGDVLSKTGNR